MIPPGSIERRFRMHVPSSTENLVMIREFVGKIGLQAGMTEHEAAMLEMAVDEACANVMEHAYEQDVKNEVSVRVTLDGECIAIEVVDTGKGFDPGVVEQKALDKLIHERRSGGLGMRMMKTVMDEVHYEIVPGVKNELRMVKKLKRIS